MARLTFKTFFGDEEKLVVVSSPSGINGDHYHIMVDNYLEGNIYFYDHQPTRWYLSPRSILTTADVEALIELLTENKNAPGDVQGA